MKKLTVLIACLTIAFAASSQTGSPETDRPEGDSLTCYTPTQIRQIAKALTELDYCREQMEINRQIIAKGQELHTQTAIYLEACEQEMVSCAEKAAHLKKQRKWWAMAGMAVGVVISAVAGE